MAGPPAVGGRLNMDIELRGFKELGRKVAGATEQDGFIAVPWRRAMNDLGRLAEGGPVTTAPMHTGATVNKMAHKVHKAAMPRYVVVKTTARRGRYSYPRFTNYSPVSSRMRPATKSGTLRRTRPNPNKGWFERGIQRIWPAVQPILERAARQIEARWAA